MDFKRLGRNLLRYLAIYCVFGIVGIVFFLVPWLRSRRSDRPEA